MRVDVLEVEGLAPVDAATLLAGTVATRVAESLATRTGGNPLAMLEIARELTEGSGEATSRSAMCSRSATCWPGPSRDGPRTLTRSQRQALVLAAAEPSLRREQLAAAASGRRLPESVV